MRADAAGNASKILDAAQRVMTTSGTWSLAQIAKAAGVAEATLYRHFPNRDALARALYAQAWNEEIAPLIGTLMDAGAPRPTLVHIGDHLVHMLARHADEIRAVDDLASATVELLTSHEENLANLVHAAHESGDLRPDFIVLRRDRLDVVIDEIAHGSAVHRRCRARSHRVHRP